MIHNKKLKYFEGSNFLLDNAYPSIIGNNSTGNSCTDSYSTGDVWNFFITTSKCDVPVRRERTDLMAVAGFKSAMLRVGLAVLVILRMIFSPETVTEEMAVTAFRRACNQFGLQQCFANGGPGGNDNSHNSGSLICAGSSTVHGSNGNGGDGGTITDCIVDCFANGGPGGNDNSHNSGISNNGNGGNGGKIDLCVGDLQAVPCKVTEEVVALVIAVIQEVTTVMEGTAASRGHCKF